MEASHHHRLHGFHHVGDIHHKLKGLFYIENRTVRFKAFYFLYYLGCGALRNYLPVYFKHIGLSALLTGVLTGVRPFTGFVSAPFFSFIADKRSSHKLILLISLIVSVIAYFSLSFVAIVRQIERGRANGCAHNQTIINSQHQFETVHSFTSDSSFVMKRNQYKSNIVEISPTQSSGIKSTDHNFGGKIKTIAPLKDIGYHNNTPNTTLPSCNTAVFSETTIFFGSFGLIILGDFFNAPVGSIMCSTVIYWEGSSQFGKQRVFGALGFGLGSLLTGIAIDKTFHINYFDSDSQRGRMPNYLTAFFIYLSANGLLFFLISCGLDVVREEKSKIKWSRVREILSDTLVICFLFYVFIMGVVGGVIMLFLFWFLESLGASQSLLGLSSAVMSLSEIPVFVMCSRLINYLGHVGVLCLSLTVSVVRVTCYSFLTNPWYVLLIEPLHGITLAAMWSCAISFASLLATPDLYTTIEGVVTGVHFGLGWGLGAIFGGLFYHAYGARNLFRGCIILCVIGYVVLGVVYKLKQRKNCIITKLDDSFAKRVNVNVGDYDIIPGENVS